MFVTRQVVAQIETDRSSPNITTLEAFAKALEVPLVRLISDDDLVAVIRCRDCRNYQDDGTCDILNDLKFGPDDYCSCADRRTG